MKIYRNISKKRFQKVLTYKMVDDIILSVAPRGNEVKETRKALEIQGCKRPEH
ncbi:protein of unknown function [Petrocella atlantisensis]|uniref:Uncharacterized protein n=1 Tax=Petrocella atlantisensis TaxID=2173034 RepID=A0A3P7RYI7_9FIRM|nr:hypothetical protein [Petrocella atlantisensis]VDN47816.1 protein of unknown function [Petrocella atlantisensis]